MNVCPGCGEFLADRYCYACAIATLPQDLVPNRCWDCGHPITTPLPQRHWVGLCARCTEIYELRKDRV